MKELKTESSSIYSSCSVRLCTILKNMVSLIDNKENASIINEFNQYMEQKGSSENHKVNNLKVVIDLAKFLGPLSFYGLTKREQVLSFLSKKIKPVDIDPEKRWITTWNHYLNRIKLFERWLYNYQLKKHEGLEEVEDWVTPDFCRIKPKQTKRLSPYRESEIWDREDLITLIKYEPNIRNKAILSLLWDLNARPHEISLLLIKSIRLKERYGEGEIPYQAKTGSGPILLMLSFCYVRDWLNQHPFKNEPNARLICNLNTGAAIRPKTIWNVMNQLKRRVERLLQSNEISNQAECEKLEYLLKTKKFNPYCIRHSSITSDSDYLPEYALKKKCRWSMNSRQGNRYIKTRMGNDLKQKILVHNGVVAPKELKEKPPVYDCPRCNLMNPVDNKFCSNCSYPLTPSGFEEIRQEEELKLKELKEKYENDLNEMRVHLDTKLEEIVWLIQQNPALVNIKPNVLKNKVPD